MNFSLLIVLIEYFLICLVRDEIFFSLRSSQQQKILFLHWPWLQALIKVNERILREVENYLHDSSEIVVDPLFLCSYQIQITNSDQVHHFFLNQIQIHRFHLNFLHDH